MKNLSWKNDEHNKITNMELEVWDLSEFASLIGLPFSETISTLQLYGLPIKQYSRAGIRICYNFGLQRYDEVILAEIP